MSQEMQTDLITWWEGQSFAGKELFTLDAAGDLTLLQNNTIKERVIAKLSAENASVVLNTLQEKFGTLEARIREMEIEWLATEDKQKLAEKISTLKEQLHTVAGVGDFKKAGLLIHDWEHTIYTITEENYAIKLRLTELAESMAESDNWKEAAQVLKDIADGWKQAGYVDRSRNEKLWSRVENARKVFHDRKRLHHTEEEKDMLHNLDIKIDLVEQAESIAASEDWKVTTDTFQRLTEEWKTIGHTLNKKNEELWQRFITAKNVFFDRKKVHSAKIQVEQDQSYIVKLAIVEKAEALKDSTDWNPTAAVLIALMEDWKKSGRAGKEKDDELWARFSGAKEIFFDAKKKHFDAIREVQENNYNLKKALFDRAEEIKNSNQWSDTTTRMQELMDEWKTIGPVPRSYGDKLWEDFNAARRYFFDRKDASREQRKQYAIEQESLRAEQTKEQEASRIAQTKEREEARIAHAKGEVSRLQSDIKEEQEKLADFKNGLENITPGKKAAELKALLENLIIESTANLKRLQEKHASAVAADKKEDAATVPPVTEATAATAD